MTEQLSEAAVIVELSLGEYALVRQTYQLEIAGAIQEYLDTPKAKVTKFRNIFKRAIANAFDDAMVIGYADGGGGDFREEGSQEDKSWLTAKIEAEFGYVTMLFQQLKDLRDEGQEAYAGEAERRAAGYAKTLDGVYNEGRLRGAKNKMLTFGGDDGEESCRTCQKHKGQRHRASWWIKRGLVPGQPGNHNYECGGYNCRHYLFDDNGNLFTF